MPIDPKRLIQSAAGAPPGPGTPSVGAPPTAVPGQPNNPAGTPLAKHDDPGGVPNDPLDDIGAQLAQAMRANPQLALQIAALLEKGGSQPMDDGMGGGAPMGGAPTGAPSGAPMGGGGMPGGAPGGAPSGMPGGGMSGMPQGRPQGMPPGMPQGGQQGNPQMAQFQSQMQQMQQYQSQQQLQQEIARLSQTYGQQRGQFGDLLPEQYNDKATLQAIAPLLDAFTKAGVPIPMQLSQLLDLGHSHATLQSLLSGEGTVRDRMLAGAAQNKGQVAPVEGRGGGIAAAQSPGKPTGQADKMARLKSLAETMFSGQS